MDEYAPTTKQLSEESNTQEPNDWVIFSFFNESEDSEKMEASSKSEKQSKGEVHLPKTLFVMRELFLPVSTGIREFHFVIKLNLIVGTINSSKVPPVRGSSIVEVDFFGFIILESVMVFSFCYYV
eukprot:TRINITY_DN144_c0_g1_i3.p2 TRINITY_DN144_c0_g1~~TRINITY_DN144_c0_g1_i3.p2  ORF type:complete len:125 (-),score=7.47 TRINITY_DN144_c0_g1_i3:283-657(-)